MDTDDAVLNEAADIIEDGTIGNDAEAKRRVVVAAALRRLAHIKQTHPSLPEEGTHDRHRT